MFGVVLCIVAELVLVEFLIANIGRVYAVCYTTTMDNGILTLINIFSCVTVLAVASNIKIKHHYYIVGTLVMKYDGMIDVILF